MALNEKTLTELREIKRKLEEQIRRNPQHSRMQRVELEDVNQWIQLRLRESQTESGNHASKSPNRMQFRLIRVVDFVAESLEAEAARMPPSMKPQADNLHHTAKILRESDNPKMVRVWEEQAENSGPDLIRPDPPSY